MGSFIDTHRVAQRPAIAFDGNLHNISISQTNVVAEAEAIGAKKVDMDIAGATVCRIFEMMMFNICEAVAHFRFATAKGLAPKYVSVPLDSDGNRNRGKFWIYY